MGRISGPPGGRTVRRARAGRFTVEFLEARALLADGIAPQPVPPLMGSPGVPFTNVPVATFTITDQSGSPGTKWNAQVNWGDGQPDKRVVATAGPGSTFQFLDSHTYSQPGTFPITVMIAVPGSHKPNDNVVTTTAVIQAAATGSVSGFVFNDTNDDGSQNNGEVGLPGWTVNLSSGTTVVGSAVTGADGGYTIQGVAPGTYTLSEVVQPGYTQTAPPPPGTYTVTLASGQAVTGKNFGNVLPVLKSIAISPANPTVAQGFSQQLAATGTFSDSSSRDVTGQVTWASAETSVATVSNAPGSQGLATGVAPGSTTVTASLNGVTTSTTLTVNAATLRSIAVTPPNPSIARGATQQFTATGAFSDNSSQDITSQVTWVSADPTVASVSNTGLATALATGTSGISASLGGVAASTVLTVTPPALVSVAVTPVNPTVARGATQQFTATADFSDATTQDVTGQAVWTSSAPAVATVSATGLAATVAQGTSTVSATFDGLSGSSVLTVGPPPPRLFPVVGLHFQAKESKTFNHFVAYFKEPNTKTQLFHAFVNYGDGSKPAHGHIHGEGYGRYAVIGSHRYTKSGVYTITVSIRDPFGVKESVTSVVHVNKP
jgi:hypothetical protein